LQELQDDPEVAQSRCFRRWRDACQRIRYVARCFDQCII